MTILFRYMLRELVKMFTLCLAGLMTIYLVVDFFEKIRGLLRYDVQLVILVEYFVLRTPAICFQIAPLAVLMATLLTLGILSRNREILAMRSSGISLLRVAAPFLVLSFAVTVLLFLLSAVIIPHAVARAEYLKTARIEKKPVGPLLRTGRSWIQIGNRTLMNFDLVEPNGFMLRGVRLYQMGERFQLLRMTEAASAIYTSQGWVLSNGIHRTFLPDGGVTVEPFERAPMPLSQTPEELSSWLSTDTEEMTLMELRSYIERLRQDGYPVNRFLTDYHGRMAFPFVSVIMAVVGIAVSLRHSGTRGYGMAMGIGLALVIGFLYWTTHSIALALGHSGVLRPEFAGWLANLVFLSYGSALLMQIRH
jgi:lipopolysaccharide export system permease protein